MEGDGGSARGHRRAGDAPEPRLSASKPSPPTPRDPTGSSSGEGEGCRAPEQLKEEMKRIKEARATAEAQDTFAADLKKRLDAATAECDKLKEAAANAESEVK